MIRDVVLTRINLLLLALLAAVTAYAFVAVPADAILPVHWGPDGQADRFAGRTEAFLMMPVIVLAMCGLFAAIVRYMPREQVEGGKYGLGVIISALLVLFLTIQSGLLAAHRTRNAGGHGATHHAGHGAVADRDG